MFQTSAGGKGMLHGKFPSIMKLDVGLEAEKVAEAPKDTVKA